MNIDNLKSQWQSLDIQPDPQSAKETERMVARQRVESLGKRYYRMCMRMTAIAAIGLCTISTYGTVAPVFTIITMAFFVMMGFMQLGQALYVKRIDFGSMSVREAVEKVYKMQRMRVIKRTIGIVSGVPVLIYMFFTFSSIFGPYILYGMTAGLAIGLGCALYINNAANRLLKQMKEQLNE